MAEIMDHLLLRLHAKGLTDREVPRLVRDVLNILNDGVLLTMGTINSRLSTLGWEEDVMDGYVFELILRIIEEDTGRSGLGWSSGSL